MSFYLALLCFLFALVSFRFFFGDSRLRLDQRLASVGTENGSLLFVFIALIFVIFDHDATGSRADERSNARNRSNRRMIFCQKTPPSRPQSPLQILHIEFGCVFVLFCFVCFFFAPNNSSSYANISIVLFVERIFRCIPVL